MDKPKGERMTAPVAFSQTETRYRTGDAQIEVKIVDSAFQQMLVAPWAMFLAAGYEKKPTTGEADRHQSAAGLRRARCTATSSRGWASDIRRSLDAVIELRAR